MEWQDDLPDVSKWQPDKGHKENLRNGLLMTCHAAQRRMIAEAASERGFNIHNFDSGLGVEDIVRQEISRLLPDRYSVEPGVVNDQNGDTAGECDVLIRNKIWAPVVKLGATSDSRRLHFPIEAIYSAVEVKQTLGFGELDGAMKKLVKLSRLNRPQHPYGHITENQHLSNLDRGGHILNPLHTAVLGTRIKNGVSFREIALRFGRINASLSREEMVTVLCVLGHGVALYLLDDGNSGYRHATFMYDRQTNIVMGIYDKEPDNAFHIFFMHLLGHLTRSVLEVHDLHRRYGDFSATSDFTQWNNAKFNQFARTSD